MYTFGFSWKIWNSPKPIAPAKDILDYLKEAAEEQGMVEKIQFNPDVQSADWKSTDNCWHIVTSKGVRYLTKFNIYTSQVLYTFQGSQHLGRQKIAWFLAD